MQLEGNFQARDLLLCGSKRLIPYKLELLLSGPARVKQAANEILGQIQS